MNIIDLPDPVGWLRSGQTAEFWMSLDDKSRAAIHKAAKIREAEFASILALVLSGRGDAVLGEISPEAGEDAGNLDALNRALAGSS